MWDGGGVGGVGAVRPVRRRWRGKVPMGWRTEGWVRVAVRVVGGKIRVEVRVGVGGRRARLRLRGWVRVGVSTGFVAVAERW